MGRGSSRFTSECAKRYFLLGFAGVCVGGWAEGDSKKFLGEMVAHPPPPPSNSSSWNPEGMGKDEEKPGGRRRHVTRIVSLVTVNCTCTVPHIAGAIHAKDFFPKANYVSVQVLLFFRTILYIYTDT